MKNQYFGDIKDLFKYDLVENLVRCVPGIHRFTFVPMLTKNDDGTDGNKRDYSERPGSSNTALKAYLDKCESLDRRDISEIREYYKARGIDIEIYHEDELFAHATRREYFSGINDTLLAHAVILLDPDNGFEIKKSNKRHVLGIEVADLFKRMTVDSILVVFQHFRREKHDQTIKTVSESLKKACCGHKPLWVCNKEIIFFLLGKDPKVREALELVVKEYAKRYQGEKGIKSCLNTGSGGR